jgi:chemotaxis protein MotB
MRLRKRRPFYQKDEAVDRQRWLTTFNDMITLLMVFFVLLFTMSSMDANRFKSFQNALQSALGVLYEGRHTSVGALSDASPPADRPMPYDIPEQPREDSKGLNSLRETSGLEAQYTARGIQLTLDDKLLFGSGKAALTNEGNALLDRVCAVIRPLNRNVRVEGHTDNVPIATERYASNWELSAARAITVVKYLIDPGGISPSRLSAAGYGDSKPRVANTTIANQSKNRRVEIILGQVVESSDTQDDPDSQWRN